MKRVFCLLLLMSLLSGCGVVLAEMEETANSTGMTAAQTVTTTVATAPTEPLPEHSELYIPDVPVEDVIRYFQEVVLDAEFSTGSGNVSLVQKWTEPILYRIEGAPTEEDLAVLENFVAWLNTIPGFPGMYPTDGDSYESLYIYFCGEQELMNRLGNHLAGTDGAVTFWYRDNKIYEAVICYRVDIPQFTRNSVILEEIYNGLGPMQDTKLREDSIIFSGFSEPQALTEMDELILKLLYHPDIQCGMTAEECEAVIRALYY